MRIVLLTAALLLGACQPMGAEDMPPVTGERSIESLSATECAARGGQMVAQGRMQTTLCQIRFADAGKPCRDGDDCQGDCRVAEPLGQTRAGQTVTGQCVAASGNFGCYTRVENGKAEPTICID